MVLKTGFAANSRLSFSEHIAGLYKKARRHINALSSLSKTFDMPTKLVPMKTFALSHFNFWPTVWYFCKSWDTLKIEKVQYRDLKHVFNDFNFSFKAPR